MQGDERETVTREMAARGTEEQELVRAQRTGGIKVQDKT